jgi:hypothetical protein
LPLCNWKKKA